MKKMIVLKQIYNYCKTTWVKRIKQFKIFLFKKAEELTASITSILL